MGLNRRSYATAGIQHMEITWYRIRKVTVVYFTIYRSLVNEH